MSGLVWGALLRILQSFLQGSPFIFTGLCIAGMLSRLMGHADTKRLFGSNSVSSLVQSWFIGMLLPGCSLGVIPICRQMRASGIAIGTIFAFALSSPLFDPLSLLYGLTLSKPFTILAFATCSLVVVTLSGAIFDWLYPNTEVQVPEPAAVPYGIKRILAIGVEMAYETVGGSAALIGIGIQGFVAFVFYTVNTLFIIGCSQFYFQDFKIFCLFYFPRQILQLINGNGIT